MKLYLVSCGTAFKNKGVQAMLDSVIDFMPSPLDVPAIKGLMMTKITQRVLENHLTMNHLHH